MAKVTVKNPEEGIEEEIEEHFSDEDVLEDEDVEENVDEEDKNPEDEEKKPDDSGESEEDEDESDEDDPIQKMRDFINSEAEKALNSDTQPQTVAPIQVTKDDFDSLETFEDFQKYIKRIKENTTKIVSISVSQESDMKNQLAKFESDNPDLNPYSNVVALVIKNIMKENPGLGFKTVLKNAEKVVRGQLNLKKTNKLPAKKSSKIKRPKATRNKSKDKRTSLQKEIDELIQF